MRTAALVFCAALLAPAACRAGEPWVEATDIVHHPFSADFDAGGRLRLSIRSGEIHIVGTSDPKVSVALSGWSSHEEKAKKVKVKFRRNGRDGEMKITGGPSNDLTITVHVPSETDLHARIPFGEVSIERVRGSHDVELHAGDLTIDVGDPKDYGHVDASVNAGDLDGGPFEQYKDGLFRSFKVEGEGRYRLHAHVGAGDLVLEASSRDNAAVR
ncbi:MAG TPA: hypothetical protein VH854_03075 [Thermoanaerobaculia bacterium]|jgi:hypothetical protein|nr:hypothetical protein [Thermoanaerobaculia bacterium]